MKIIVFLFTAACHVFYAMPIILFLLLAYWAWPSQHESDCVTYMMMGTSVPRSCSPNEEL